MNIQQEKSRLTKYEALLNGIRRVMMALILGTITIVTLSNWDIMDKVIGINVAISMVLTDIHIGLWLDTKKTQLDVEILKEENK